MFQAGCDSSKNTLNHQTIGIFRDPFGSDVMTQARVKHYLKVILFMLFVQANTCVVLTSNVWGCSSSGSVVAKPAAGVASSQNSVHTELDLREQSQSVLLEPRPRILGTGVWQSQQETSPTLPLQVAVSRALYCPSIFD